MGDFLDQFERIPLAQKLLLLVLLVAGLSLVFYFLVYTEQVDNIDNARQEVRELTERQAELRSDIDDIDRIREEVRLLCQRQQAFMERLPGSPGISDLISSLESQAQLSGLDIASQNRGADRQGDNYTTIPMDLQLEGTYEQITNFFAHVGRQQRIVNFRNISLSVDSQDTDDGSGPRLRASASLATYYAGDDQMEGVEACDI